MRTRPRGPSVASAASSTASTARARRRSGATARCSAAPTPRWTPRTKTGKSPGQSARVWRPSRASLARSCAAPIRGPTLSLSATSFRRPRRRWARPRRSTENSHSHLRRRVQSVCSHEDCRKPPPHTAVHVRRPLVGPSAPFLRRNLHLLVGGDGLVRPRTTPLPRQVSQGHVQGGHEVRCRPVCPFKPSGWPWSPACPTSSAASPGSPRCPGAP
mmetsp:Transcript_3589/g.12043  ORF Transcript_3589/g.12043 Transcript_3589/m.12043 type:complete len:215 (-) Transcript_3589:839-1483(-)